MKPIKGRRVYPDAEGKTSFAEGDYGFMPGYGWVGRPPGFHAGSFTKHDVTEHEDGTITVSPSILITYPTPDGDIRWHGYLEKGEWREV